MKVVLDEDKFSEAFVNNGHVFLNTDKILKSLAFNSQSKGYQLLATVNIHDTWSQC